MRRPPPRIRTTSSTPPIPCTKLWHSSCRSNYCRALLRAHRVADVDVADMLLLPHHRIHDPGAAGGVVIKDDLFPFPGLELAVGGKLEHRGGERIRLAHRIQPENISLMLGRSRDAVAERRDQEKENRSQRHQQRQARD